MTRTAIWVAGQPVHGDESVQIRHPYDGEIVGETSWATHSQVETAVAAADASAPAAAQAPAHVRAAACQHVAERLRAETEAVAELITAENGKPLRWSRIEVNRAISTFAWAAEEARRFGGQLQRLDTDPGATGRGGLIRRFPYGPVLGITPFNFPLNLVAHKLAPAVAVGAPVIIKPAPATPLSALWLGEVLAETELASGAVSVLPVPNDAAPALVSDPRLPVVSFTGSDKVGWSIREAVPRKHVTLELGGNAAALVCEDYHSPDDLAWAVERIATFGNYQAGQSCIAVQRVIVHDSLYDRFCAALSEKIASLTDGDPRDESVEVGPLINAEAAQRVAQWVEEAVAGGAQLWCGGQRDGARLSPALLTRVPGDSRLTTEEAFGPVVTVRSVPDLDAGLAAVNDSRYGLQAGVFTKRLDVAARAHRELRVGGVIVGDVPSFRADQMPYGGDKASGVGREGVASAMDDYTQPRIMVLPELL